MDAESWRQAKGVLAEALLCPPSEREAFILARCADPDLRREVQAYLDEYDEDFLESVLTVSEALDSTNSAADDAAQLPDIRNGDRIGPYIVLDRLGVGGMGHVFLGNDTRLHRKVALKCLIASASATELRSRILHEARAAARITHPNIAIVHDVVEHENRPFLVMEYVEGESLATLIKRERPSIDKVVMFMRQLASALAAAHAKGIVHRDLKPANIQVTPDGSVKILDFGVAHAMSAASMGSTTSSAAGLTVSMGTATVPGDRRVMHPGTPAYMSPEQMFGRPIDQRSDIYSLGVIVYEMTTGHRPYSTDDPLEVVLTLSRNFLRPGDPSTSLPSQINDIVSKMLAVKPDDRYQTAGELENALIVLTAPPAVSDDDASPRRWLRTAVRAIGGAVVVAAAATMLGYIETGSFNITLGRIAPFNEDTWPVWLEFGLRGLVLPGALVLGWFMAIAAVRFLVRVLSLSRGIEHFVTTGVSRTAQFSSRLGLDDPNVLAQAVAGLGAALLGAIVWYFYTFVRAWASASISTLPLDQFYPLQPGRPHLYAQLYLVSLSALLCFFGVAIARIRRLRGLQSIRAGGAAVAVVGTLAIITVIMCVMPYRIEWQNKRPRLDVAGERCYEIGAHLDDVLVFCPERQPPRNRVIKRGDPAVRDLGVSENIFTPPETSQH